MTSAPIGSVTSTSFRLCVRAPRMMSFEDEEVAVSDMRPPDRAPGGDPKLVIVLEAGTIGKREGALGYGLWALGNAVPKAQSPEPKAQSLKPSHAGISSESASSDAPATRQGIVSVTPKRPSRKRTAGAEC